jgi:16S rRNA (guanine527-N7)-methyltransferase
MGRPATPKAVDGPAAFAEAFKVPRETIHRLTRYSELLAHWQKSTNLVAPSTLPVLWSRHFTDSAQLAKLAPEARLWLDLGSGAGFPGLVVAIINAGKADFRMHLVEASRKKCAFLSEVARETGASVTVHAERIEALAERADKPAPDVVSARALAPLQQLLELAAPFFVAKTRGLFLKGRDAESEIEAARETWTFDARLHPSLTATDAHVVEIANLQPREHPSAARAP